MKMIQVEHSKIERVLVIKPRAIGDVLLSTSVLPNLKAHFPNARVDFLVEKFASPVVDDNPYIDNVLSFDVKEQNSVSIIMQVRRNKYDLVIDLFANPRTAIITMFSGAGYRVGYPFKWRRFAYNIIVPSRKMEHHNVDFNLDAIRTIDIPVRSASPQFFLNNSSKLFANKFLDDHNLSKNKFITINIGGGWEIKRWKVDKFIKLSQMIRERLGLQAVVLYGPSEENDAKKISAASGAIMAPKTSLHEMGAIIKESLLLVTNDSGPMHIAAALDVPTLSIFGPTSPRAQGPYGNLSEIVRNEKLECLECNLTKCPIGNPCMVELETESVFQKLLALISRIDWERSLQKNEAIRNHV